MMHPNLLVGLACLSVYLLCVGPVVLVCASCVCGGTWDVLGALVDGQDTTKRDKGAGEAKTGDPPRQGRRCACLSSMLASLCTQHQCLCAVLVVWAVMSVVMFQWALAVHIQVATGALKPVDGCPVTPM